MQSPSSSPTPARAERIAAALERAFAPSLLRVEDDSARHVGHAGHDPAGETHYNVLVVAAAFRGRSRVERSRAVHETLAAEFGRGLHAISLVLRTPEEHQLLVDK